jgi:MarR family protein
MSLPDESGGSWMLLTGHGHVLVEIARNPQVRIRDIATAAGITERTTQAIVADLAAAGYLTRTRAGRRTRYAVNPDRPFRHRAQKGLRVGPFLDLLTATGTPPAAQELPQVAPINVRSWEQNGSGDGRSDDLRRGDRASSVGR